MNEQEKSEARKENRIYLDTWNLLLQWQEENMGCIQCITARDILDDLEFFIPDIEEQYSRDTVHEAMKKVQPEVDSMESYNKYGTWSDAMKALVQEELGITY